jgi:hypothetical protein
MLRESRRREAVMTIRGGDRSALAAARGCAVALVACLGSLALATVAGARPYPSKTIRIIVPYAPGGAGDVIARIVSQPLAASFGQFDRPGMRERVIREVGAIYKGSLYFGEDLMKIPFNSPAPAKLD